MKTLLISVLAAAIVSVGVVMLVPRASEVVQQFAGTSPDVISPYLKWGNIEHFASNVELKTSTTTPCVIQSPSATSTLIRTAMHIDVATSTATKWTAAQAAAGTYATTTLLSALEFAVASGKQATILVTASTTSGTLPGDNAFTFAPNSLLVWGVQGVANIAGGNSSLLAGRCSAEWAVVSR